MWIDADAPAVQRAAARLLDLADAHGAVMASDAVVRVRGSHAWVAGDGRPPRGGMLFAMPPEVMPDVKRARLALRDGALSIQDPGSQDMPSQTAALELMVELYNVLDRPALWRRRSPWHALAGDPAVLDHLLSGRALGAEADLRRHMLAEGQDDDLLVRTFLATRTYPLEGGGRDGGRASLLMPFIDLLDHDWRARPFHRRPLATGRSVICTHRDRPVPDDDAFYVQYSALDPLTSLLLFGFVDPSGPIANSVPATLRLANGATIRVLGEPVGPGGAVPRSLRGLGLHAPAVYEASGHELSVAFLIVAGASADDALPKVLDHLVGRLCPDLDPARRRDEVAELQAQLYDLNVAFHRRTIAQVDRALSAATVSPAAGRSAVLASARAAAEQGLDRLRQGSAA